MGFSSSSDGKSICLQCGLGHINPWVGKIPWRRKWQLIPVFLPVEFHGQRRLVGCKESDTTEQLTHIDNIIAVILNEYFQWIILLLVLLINCLNFKPFLFLLCPLLLNEYLIMILFISTNGLFSVYIDFCFWGECSKADFYGPAICLTYSLNIVYTITAVYVHFFSHPLCCCLQTIYFCML